MKFTVSTLAAMALAAPMAAVQALDIRIPVETTINGGLMKVFPTGEPVKLQFYEGQNPEYVGDLSFTSLYQVQRFDIIDDRQEDPPKPTQNWYYKVSLLSLGEQRCAD